MLVGNGTVVSYQCHSMDEAVDMVAAVYNGRKNRSSASITILQKYMPFIFLGGRLFVLSIQRFSGEASRFYQQFDILRHDFQQFDALWAVAQPCKLHTMGIGEQKKRCKDVFVINIAAVFGIRETTRN